MNAGTLTDRNDLIIDNGAIRYRNDVAGFLGDESVQKKYLAV